MPRVYKIEPSLNKMTSQVPGQIQRDPGALSDVVVSLGKTGAEIGQMIQRASSLHEKTRAQNYLDSTLSDIRSRAEADNDISERSRKKYSDEIDKAISDSSNLLTIPLERDLYYQEALGNGDMARRQIDNGFTKKNIDLGRAEAEIYVNNKLNDYLKTVNPKEKEKAVLDRNNKIREAVEAGYLDPADALKMRDAQDKKWAIAQVDYDISVDPSFAKGALETGQYENLDEVEKVALLKKAEAQIKANSADLLDELNSKFLNDELTFEEVEAANRPREEGGIGAISARKLFNDLSGMQARKLTSIADSSDKAQKYVDLINRTLLNPQDQYKARQILVDAYADDVVDSSEAKKINKLYDLVSKQKFTRDHPMLNQIPIINSWFGNNETRKTELATSLSNYTTYLEQGKSPEEARNLTLNEQYNKTYPEQPLGKDESALAPKQDKDIKYTPLAEKIGKGFGMGVAGMTEGFGGALKWMGAKDVGKAITDYSKEMKDFYAVPDPDFIYHLSGGAASGATFLLPGLGIARGVQALTAFPRLGAWLGISASTAMEATIEAGSNYERAVNKGMSDKLAQQTATRTFWTNVPTLAVSNALGGIFGKGKGGMILKALRGGTFEGVQEFTQSVISNIYVNDPVFQGAFESTAIGAIVGGGVSMTDSASTALKDLGETKKQFDDLKSKREQETFEVGGDGEDVQVTGGEVVELNDEPITEFGKQIRDQIIARENVPLHPAKEAKAELSKIAPEDPDPNYALEKGQQVADIIENQLSKPKGQAGKKREQLKSIPRQFNNPNDPKMLNYLAEYIDPKIIAGMKPEERLILGNSSANALRDFALSLSDIESQKAYMGEQVAQQKEGEPAGKPGLKKEELQKVSPVRKMAGQSMLSNKGGFVTIPDLPRMDPRLRKDLNQFTDAAIVPLSTRLARIDERLRDTVRRFEFNKGMAIKEDIDIAGPFMKKMDQINENDQAQLDIALKNSDIKTVENIVLQNNMVEEYKAMRDLLDNIYSRAQAAGIDVSYIDNYFPRRVNDVESFLDYLHGQENWSMIDKAIKQEEEKAGRKLDPDEQAEFINKMMRGVGNQQIRTGKPSNVKERQIQVVDEQMNSFYKNSMTTLQEYIVAMNNAIEARKFFGMDKAKVDDSIGQYVQELREQGMISGTQEQEVKRIFQAMFHNKGLNGIWSFYKNLGYIYTMGSPLSAITQIGDLAFSLYENGFYSTIAGAKEALGKDKITKEDLGINAIIEEFADTSKSGKAVRKIFDIVGLTKMDNLGKETLINGALNSMSKKSAANDPELTKEVNRVFGEEAPQVLADLKSKTPSTNVKYLLFSKLLDYQPVAISEMPEYYSTGTEGIIPGRVFYMLKSYTIKQLDVYHNEVLMKFKNNKTEAIGNMLKLALALGLANASADAIKDVLLGRPIKLSDLAQDNILKMMAFSKYSIYQSKKDGLVAALRASLLPPVPFVDDLYRDMLAKDKELKDLKVWNAIPLVGKFYYWWFGGGKNVKKKMKMGVEPVSF